MIPFHIMPNAGPMPPINCENPSHSACQTFFPVSVCVKNQTKMPVSAANASTTAPIGFMLITTLKAACAAVAIFVTLDHPDVAICAAFTAMAYPAHAAISGDKAGVKNLTTCKAPFNASRTPFKAADNDSGGNNAPHPPTMLNTSLKMSHNDCHIALKDSNTPTFCIAAKSFPNQSIAPLIAADNGACIELVRSLIASAIALIA